ncbi:hypothetical protein EMIT043CA1_10372 [Pseudomonas brassicacearum]
MKPGSKGLVLNRVDSCAALVFDASKRGKTIKNVTGSPYPVSKSRILCALSVDALCCFGAKKFQVVRKSYSVEALPGLWHGPVRTLPCRLRCVGASGCTG